jgi:hypothetical protein
MATWAFCQRTTAAVASKRSVPVTIDKRVERERDGGMSMRFSVCGAWPNDLFGVSYD